jgi:PAS domain S-box-containing protein
MRALRSAQERLHEQHESLRQMHAQMVRARHRYRSLFEQASVAYLTLSSGGLVLDINEAAASLLGARRVIMRNAPLATWIAPEDLPVFVRHLETCRQKEGTIATELHMIDSAGEPIPVQLVTRRICDPDYGTELRTVAVDIRALKSAQAELRKAHNELEKRVEERTAELRAANERLAAEVSRREQLEGEVIAVSERERRRFGQDLHDETCQTLGGLSLTAGLLARRLERTDAEAAALARELAKGLGAAIEQTRAIARGLHPVTMEGGLAAALQSLAARIGPKVECRLRCRPDLRLPEEVALTLYRIAQEATTNALKHAGARQLTIEAWKTADSVALSVEDDGVGLPKLPPQHDGMGLDIMGFRARLLGGSCVVQAGRTKGTRVLCVIPWRRRKKKSGKKSRRRSNLTARNEIR